MTRALKTRNKNGLIDGTEFKDKKDLVKSLNLMILCVFGFLALCPSPLILDMHVLNLLLICELNYMILTSVFNIHQHINSVTQSGLFDYYKKLDGLTNCSECACEAVIQFNKHSKLVKLMQFLSGLDESFTRVVKIESVF